MQANPTLLQKKYTRIVALFAQKTGLPLEVALEKFFDSRLYPLVNEGVADMHCLSEGYLADELLMEYDYVPDPTHRHVAIQKEESSTQMVADDSELAENM